MKNNKEYTKICNIVKIRDQNGNLYTRDYQPNIGKVLCMENRKEVLEEALRQEKGILEGLKLDISTSFFLKRISLKRRKSGSEATMKLLHRELSITEIALKDLERNSKEDKATIDQMKTIEVDEDQEYMFELLSRLGTISILGEKRKKLVKMDNKGILDNYLDKIGCREEDKSIYKELLGLPNSSCFQPSILKKK